MPKRKHSFLQELFPNSYLRKRALYCDPLGLEKSRRISQPSRICQDTVQIKYLNIAHTQGCVVACKWSDPMFLHVQYKVTGRKHCTRLSPCHVRPCAKLTSVKEFTCSSMWIGDSVFWYLSFHTSLPFVYPARFSTWDLTIWHVVKGTCHYL